MDPVTASFLLSAATAGAGLGLSASQGGGPEGYSKGDLDYLAARRYEEIQDFKNRLSLIRQAFASDLSNFQTHVFNRFVPNLEAKYGPRGLQVTGGAFQSEVGKKAADFTAEQKLANVNREREDEFKVQDLLAALRSAQFGGQYGRPQPDDRSSLPGTLGTLSSGLFSYGMQKSRDDDMMNFMNKLYGVRPSLSPSFGNLFDTPYNTSSYNPLFPAPTTTKGLIEADWG